MYWKFLTILKSRENGFNRILKIEIYFPFLQINKINEKFEVFSFIFFVRIIELLYNYLRIIKKNFYLTFIYFNENFIFSMAGVAKW